MQTESLPENFFIQKTEGNQYFKEEKYELAASCYTQALKLFTPEEKDKGKLKDRGVILKNRAACYLKLVSIIHAVLTGHITYVDFY